MCGDCIKVSPLLLLAHNARTPIAFCLIIVISLKSKLSANVPYRSAIHHYLIDFTLSSRFLDFPYYNVYSP